MAHQDPDSAAHGENSEALAVARLVKTYGGRNVVDGLSFSVRRGDVFALLGPNGAGKTTTIEILEGYRTADSGTARVLGLDPTRDAAALKRRIGVVLQQGGIYPALTAREVLKLFATFHQEPEDPDDLLERVGLTLAAKTRYRRLSGGQQRRLALAVALVGRPDLVFLDEPTAGMDPQARRLTWDLIGGLKERGATTVLTTHLLDEAEQLADRIAIIDHGRLLVEGTPQELVGDTGAGGVTVRVRTAAPLCADDLLALPGVTSVRMESELRAALETTKPAVLLADLTAWLRNRNIVAQEIRVGEASLEDVFLRLTGRALRE